MYRCAWKPTIVEEIIEKIGSFLVVDEDNGTSGWHREQEIEESIALLGLVGPHDLRNVSYDYKAVEAASYHLEDVRVRRSGTTDANSDVIF